MEVWTKIIALFFMPPGILILIALLGFVIHIRSPFLGNIIVSISVAGLLILSLPVTGRLMLSPLEQDAPVLDKVQIEKMKKEADAIVILAGGRYADAPEYDGDTIGYRSLVRARYAAWLHKQTGLPILVSGGSTYNEPVTEADLIKKSLADDFGADVKWIETRSTNTFENAQFSWSILQKAEIKTVLLVTNAYHMRRAHWSFKKVGFNVVPAPTWFSTPNAADRKIFGYLPSAIGMVLSRRAIHEHLGMRWYQYKYGNYTSSAVATDGKTAAATP
jgi:uncharacterized SAM-binding protein YcdF (DUF218 family)